MYFKTYILTIVLGSLLGISGSLLMSNENEIPFLENDKIILVSGNSASCDNMFDGTSHNCNESTANCGEDVGGTGHNLSCSIQCDNGSTIRCGTNSDVEVASLPWMPCTSAS